ncbi:dynein assembly factor 5, axonemal-like [Gigantopelta aegis]|uniref:dynein assembly factor 5, axonemal-like n=1 Tax=Gigantopelta aegis TaxID=1735272 RepID=UPI001B88985A|nr:dynein assembly factor 5, axonemal-like [Gigantopelta aegis]
MATVDQNSNAVLQGIARHLNCLTEENRNIRKKAVEGLRTETIDRTPPLDPESLHLVFSEILKPLLKLLSDPVEKCRELSVSMISDFLKHVQKPDEHLPYIIPVLCQRLGQQEIVETSEEVRLSSVNLLYQIMEFSGKKLAVYLDDIIRILQRTLIDPYPEVKKQSCHCSSRLAKTIPEYFHAQTDSLVKPLLMTITHQHSKVRALVIETLGDILQFGNGKYVDDVISHFAQRLFDRTPMVRKAVTKVVGNWLLDLPDRYSFHHKLIPLLLTSITDEQPEISDLADTLWHDIGMKYEGENESDLKDKMDFAAADPSHYPQNVERPNLGCRTLVMRHLSKILPGLLRDIGDWVVETRVKSAALLYTLLLNAEDYVTQHMEKLTSSMYKACMDEDKRVVTDVRRAAELIGYFVQPEVWCKLVLTNVRQTQCSGSLMVLASVVRGSERHALKDYISQICNVIASPEICQSIQTDVHLQLLACIDAILDVLQEDSVIISQDLFTVLLTVLSQSQEPAVKQQVNGLQLKLGQTECLESVAEVYSRHSAALIESYQHCFGMWTVHSVERQIFDVLLIEAGPVVGELLDYIIPMLVTNLNPDKDPEMRLKFFALLSRLMVNAASTLDSKQRFGDFAVMVIRDMVIPNCEWRAGRTAGAIRTTAVSCCWALLQSGVLTREKLEPVVEELLTQIISTMQDDYNKTTRLVSCRVMTRIFDLMGSSLSRDRLHNIYPELLKRLDDSSDEIRVTVTKTFLGYFSCFESGYEPDLYRAHLEAIYRGLLVHLDDPEPNIQEAMLEVLKYAGELVPSMLKNEVEAVKHKHRTQRYCEQLLQHLNQINTAQ